MGGAYNQCVICILSRSTVKQHMSLSAATNICFSEKGVYTQEVLAVVLQQLLDHSPLPVLFMRTVIS